MQASLTIHATRPGHLIRPEIYGHFAEHLGRCIYEGIWVGEDSPIPNTRGIRNDVVDALSQLDMPVLRWPGGCFADEYHWKDGIGPREQRPSMINTHWGHVIENNHFGTHEFMDFCQQVGTEPYVCGNVGSGTVQEMMEWVEYMTSDADSPMVNLRRQNGREEPWELKYFGVGNESWGCGGHMRPEYYADLYRRYNTFVKDYSGKHIYRIAGGANQDDFNWTEVLMERAHKWMDGLSLHYYTLPTGDWLDKGPSTGFDEAAWHTTLRRALHMEELVTRHSAIMDKYDPDKRIGLIVDEWGSWTAVEPGTNPRFLHQQNTLRDVLVGALTLHIFHNHAGRVHMANIAQTINVLQAMVLTDKEKMLRTPTYWLFEMFKVHQGAQSLPLELKTPDYSLNSESIPAVSASATLQEKTGAIHLSLVNTHPHESARVSCTLPETRSNNVAGRILTAPEMDTHNTFDHPDRLVPAPFESAQLTENGLQVELPAKSVVILQID